MSIFAAKTNSGTLRMVHHHMSSARTRSIHQAQLRSCRTQARRRHRYQHQRECTKCLPQLRGEALHVASSSMSFSIRCIGMVTLRSSSARHANQGKSIPSVASSRSSSPTPALAVDVPGTGSGWRQSKQNWALPVVVWDTGPECNAVTSAVCKVHDSTLFFSQPSCALARLTRLIIHLRQRLCSRRSATAKATFS
jgi:hypothetical protein